MGYNKPNAIRVGLAIVAAVAAVVTMAAWQGGTAARTLLHNFADLDDHRIFANREVPRAVQASALRALSQPPAFLATLQVPDDTGTYWRLDDYLDRTKTAAFLVLQDDRVVVERYGRGYDASSLLNSFSIAKSIMGLLVGIAQAEGHIGSLDATVSSFRPEFAGSAYGSVTLKQLLTMTSGVIDAPTVLPSRSKAYYGDDLHALALQARSTAFGGHGWRYSETDIQVLGFVLARAVGMPVSTYLARKLWQPLGMEAPALWALDHPGGNEKTFCCISARARDFVRLGKLIRDRGRWNGRVLVPTVWAERRVLQGFANGTGYVHQQLWWTPDGGHGDFMAYGHNGQYVYINPDAGLVIVKFSETNQQNPVPMFRALADAVSEPTHLASIDRLDAQLMAAR